MDAAATRIVTAMEAVGAVAKGVAPTGDIAAQVATEETRALARELGAQATTMLKNAKCGAHARPLLPSAATRTAASSWSDRPIRAGTAAARWRPAIR